MLAVAACSSGDDLVTEPTEPTAPTTTSTTPATSATTADLPATSAPLLDPGAPPPPLPAPEPLPDDPWAPTPEVVQGTIEIPRIGLVDQLRAGMTLTAINRGPSWWPGTAGPGGWGNMVIAGHRTTWSAPFADLDLLTPGDEMIVTTTTGRWVYRVTGSDIVAPNATHVALQTFGHTATLFACHPKGSAAQRIVVRLELLGSDGQAVDTGDPWVLSAPPPPTSEPAVDEPATDPLTFAEG